MGADVDRSSLFTGVETAISAAAAVAAASGKISYGSERLLSALRADGHIIEDCAS